MYTAVSYYQTDCCNCALANLHNIIIAMYSFASLSLTHISRGTFRERELVLLNCVNSETIPQRANSKITTFTNLETFLKLGT